MFIGRGHNHHFDLSASATLIQWYLCVSKPLARKRSHEKVDMGFLTHAQQSYFHCFSACCAHNSRLVLDVDVQEPN